jgi:ABC-type Zn2+ transport system substrate-binding protein/surface adhesin
VARKTYHKKSTSPDMIRETKKMEAEEVKNKSHMGDTDGHVWIPHERTGIYCPKGQKKVIDDVPNVAGKDFQVNWFSYNDNI